MRVPRSHIHLGQISTIASAIQTQEGYFPGSKSYTNNNPGNLIASSWTKSQPGYVGTDSSGFAVFDSLADGQSAEQALISNYAASGATIQSMMAAWAPAGQGSNNPNLYAENVAAAAGVPITTPVADVLAGTASSASSSASDDTDDSNPISDSLGLSQYGVTDDELMIGGALLAGIVVLKLVAG